MEELTTTSEVIERLGGIASVATLTASKYNAAANWVNAKTFPAKTYVAMTEALKARGYTAPASLWGMKEPEQVR